MKAPPCKRWARRWLRKASSGDQLSLVREFFPQGVSIMPPHLVIRANSCWTKYRIGHSLQAFWKEHLLSVRISIVLGLNHLRQGISQCVSASRIAQADW